MSLDRTKIRLVFCNWVAGILVIKRSKLYFEKKIIYYAPFDKCDMEKIVKHSESIFLGIN